MVLFILGDVCSVEAISAAITTAVTNVTNWLQSNLDQSKKTSSPNSDGGDDVCETVEVTLISMLQEQRKVAANDEDVVRRNKRLKTIQKALDHQFSKLD